MPNSCMVVAHEGTDFEAGKFFGGYEASFYYLDLFIYYLDLDLSNR